MTRFVGVDGEGVDRSGGAHDYVMLSIGTRTLRIDPAREDRLSSERIFRFLWREWTRQIAHSRKDMPAWVGFYLGYDFAHWLRDVDADTAAWLLADHEDVTELPDGRRVQTWIRWRGWQLGMLGLRRFTLHRPTSSLPPVVVCDVGSFWQTSFVKAIDPASWPEPVCSKTDFDRIVAGKADRGTVLRRRSKPTVEMASYNVTENTVLATAMGRISIGLADVDVTLRRSQWIGPGQAAQRWMEGLDWPVLDPQAREDSPAVAARDGYFGGHFETFAHGHTGRAWSYDINSAYPWVISRLPCLTHSTWRWGTGQPSGEWVLCDVTVTGSDPVAGPAMYRSPRGHVLRPAGTRTWVWLAELRASCEAGLVDSIEWHQWWQLEPCRTCSPPFRKVADLYYGRLSVGKNTPEGRGRRLIMNSIYGKTAQSIGTPKYANPIVASLITSGCRTMILEAIASHPGRSRALLMVATDSVTFTEPHPGLTLDATKLGAWDETLYEDLFLWRPGIYWDAGGKIASRGVAPAVLAPHIPDIEARWRASGGRPGPTDDEWPSVTLTIPFAVLSPRQALAWGRWDEVGQPIRDRTTVQSMYPLPKRDPHLSDIGDGLCRSTVMPAAGPSTPYDKAMGLKVADREYTDVLTPDGPVSVG